ncbi:MAG: hypothetical protein VYE68_10120, partial [Acidobacteriota bacterium]|nr:hypothetical protein [Acidobacteriota bacterium]
MRQRFFQCAGSVLLVVVTSWTQLDAGQLPLAPVGTHGQTITPVYEGWYPNPDGTISLSWGYFNRNSEETVDVPVGSENRIGPGEPDQGQPTHFLPQRQRGVFTVTVPGDFGDNEVVWTLTFRGETQAIPGHLHRDWLLDALGGAASGDTPPVVRFAEDGPEHRGPGGAPAGPLTATVREPLPLVVWATDDGIYRRRNEDTEDGPPPLVELSWYLHQGPAAVSFDDDQLEIAEDGPTRAETPG